MDKSWLEVELLLSHAVPQQGNPQASLPEQRGAAQKLAAAAVESPRSAKHRWSWLPQGDPSGGADELWLNKGGLQQGKGYGGRLLGSLDWWTPPGLPSRSPAGISVT